MVRISKLDVIGRMSSWSMKYLYVLLYVFLLSVCDL